MTKPMTLNFLVCLMVLFYSCTPKDNTIFSDALDGKSNNEEWIVPPDNIIEHPVYGNIYYLKCDSIRLRTMAPWVGDETWINHQVEFELMVVDTFGFVGFDYNMQSKPNYGCNFHFSAFRDTINLQSMGMWGTNKGSWKLWPVSQKQFVLKLNEWIKFRIEAGNEFTNIYYNDTCIYTIYDTPFSNGGIRFNASYYGSAYYRNLKVVKHNNKQIKPQLKDVWEDARKLNIIKSWQISDIKPGTFAKSGLPSEVELDNLNWEEVSTDKRGVLNLGSIYPDYSTNTVVAKTYIEAQEDKELKCYVTYTDRFSLFVNREKVFKGPDRNWWNPNREKYGSSRLIPDQFEVVLPLKKGKNEILIRSEVMEDFGWGFWMRTD